MSPSLVKFCGIEKYVEDREPKLYEVLEDLCMTGFLKPKRHFNGLTIIIPLESDIKILADMRYTEKIDEAQNIMGCHIINDYLPTPATWLQKKDDIPNANRKKVDVEKVVGEKVYLKGGVEITVDKKYIPFGKFYDNKSTVVYRVVKGAIRPDENARPATFVLAKVPLPGAKPMRGGAPLMLEQDTFNVALYVKARLDEFMKNIITGQSFIAAQSSSTVENPLIEDILSYNAWIKTHDNELYTRLQCIVYSPLTTFLALFTLPEFTASVELWYKSANRAVCAESSDAAIAQYIALAECNRVDPGRSHLDELKPNWFSRPAANLYPNSKNPEESFRMDFARMLECHIFEKIRGEHELKRAAGLATVGGAQSTVHELSELVQCINEVLCNKSKLVDPKSSVFKKCMEEFMNSSHACMTVSANITSLSKLLEVYTVATVREPADTSSGGGRAFGGRAFGGSALDRLDGATPDELHEILLEVTRLTST